MKTTRILLVDNHRMFTDGLRAMLDQQEDMEVVGIAEDGRTALSMIRELSPDAVVMDITMPELNGIEATAQIRQSHPSVKIVCLSMHTERKYVQSMLEAGAHAYVIKESAGGELLLAVRKAMRGFKYLASDITETVIDGYVHREVEDSSAISQLSGREREVLQLMAEGHVSGEIASKLSLSTHTVDTHRRNIMKKLDLHSVAELTKYAIREGLTDVSG